MDLDTYQWPYCIAIVLEQRKNRHPGTKVPGLEVFGSCCMIGSCITMNWAPPNRDSRASTIFVLFLIVSLLLFAVYLKAKPDIIKSSSDHVSSHVKIWVDPNQSLDSKPKILLFCSIIILFSALFIKPHASSLLSLILMREAVPANLFFVSRRWSRPPPAL
ncbi:MAG TPA: hypothetical protein VG759_16890 [Candidatus Angelobacter sp.]|nr:hypothetical protein [Candidatus Angelobacter sp.]